MSVITIPRILREKFGDEAVEALVDVFNRSESSKDCATKADFANLRTELKTDIANLRTELKTDIAISDAVCDICVDAV
ncbi:MAG: hypothetical protein HQK89_14745 [Nitrospirae bacterium]|nr:hypothetical protein [Nitrospirota bacterium]